MQFVILFIGVMVFVFYQFNQPPIFFNKVEKNKVEQSQYASQLEKYQSDYDEAFTSKKEVLTELVDAQRAGDEQLVRQKQTEALAIQGNIDETRNQVKDLVKKVNPDAETNDKDYIFMTYVMDNLPVGMIGLLFAVMFSAAMSSTSSELNALASTSTIDLYKTIHQERSK